jgi:6-phosphofructokinase 1
MNIGLLTSGGDSPGMNAFISNFVKLSVKEKFSVFAFKFGYQGLVDNNIKRLVEEDVENIFHLGGSHIKAFRSSEFITKQGFSKALKNIEENAIDYLVILGGDGTLLGANRLAENGVKVIFIPATIDNDLFYTDKTLGFDSAVNSAVENIDKIKQTMLSLNRIFICEVMGRRCADLAKYCAVATNASALIGNKEDFNFPNLISKLVTAIENGEESPHIIVRENILDVYDLAKKIQNELDIETRASIIGYVQRGASPSVYDRIYAKQLATHTINLIKKSKHNMAAGILRNKLISTPISSAIFVNNRSNDIIE